MRDDEPLIDKALVRKAAENQARILHAIGQFTFEFSQLEFTIRVALASYLGLPNDYFDAVTGSYDFRMLCAVTSKVGSLKLPDRSDQLDKLFNECQSLNDKRVHIAHGLWTNGIEEFTVRVLNRQRLDATHYPYTGEQLQALAEKAQELMQRVLGFQS